jgi:hypothetical protein
MPRRRKTELTLDAHHIRDGIATRHIDCAGRVQPLRVRVAGSSAHHPHKLRVIGIAAIDVLTIVQPLVRQRFANRATFLDPNLRWHHFVAVHVEDPSREPFQFVGQRDRGCGSVVHLRINLLCSRSWLFGIMGAISRSRSQILHLEFAGGQFVHSIADPIEERYAALAQ